MDEVANNSAETKLYKEKLWSIFGVWSIIEYMCVQINSGVIFSTNVVKIEGENQFWEDKCRVERFKPPPVLTAWLKPVKTWF